jgi:hypothetical protein
MRAVGFVHKIVTIYVGKTAEPLLRRTLQEVVA